MFFRVKKEFKWDGREYQKGNIVTIPENHPRIEGLMLGGFIMYDASEPSPCEPDQQGIPAEKIHKSKSRGRRPQRVGV